MDKRTARILVIILFLGAFLRIWGINFGLPYQFHQDEPIIVNHALAYGSGDLNPHFFIIPPLTSYVLFIFYGVYFALLHILGLAGGTQDFAVSFFRDPAPFYLIGRLVTGFVPSVLNIFLAYKVTAKFFSKKAAAYSSLVMAVAFLNVANAHYIYADNLLVLFTLLAYLAIMEFIDKPGSMNYALSAVLIGMAAAVKYNAILLLAPFFMAYLIKYGKGITGTIFDPKLWAFTCLVFLTFIVCNPYSVLDYNFFMISITKGIWSEYIGWTHHIRHSLFQGISLPVTIGGFIGLCAALKKNAQRVLILVSFPVVFYLHLVFKSQPFSRYALVLVPFLSMGLAYLLYDYLYVRFNSRRVRLALVVLSAAILIPTIAKSAKADLLFSREDTRLIASRWIEANIPQFTKIALDHTFFTPPIKQTMAQLRDKRSITCKQPELEQLKSKKLDFQMNALGGLKTYGVYYIVPENENAGKFISFWPVIGNDLKSLKRIGIEYVIINNMESSESMQDFQKTVVDECIPVAQFSPYKSGAFKSSQDEIETTCIPIDDEELFMRQRFGPYIGIYRIR